MSEPQLPPHDPSAGGTTERHPTRRRTIWKWAAAALALLAVGLVAWGLDARADLDDANDDIAQLESDAHAREDAAGATSTTVKAAYDEVAKQLHVTSEDLSATTQDLDEAEARADEAEARADDAETDAAQANAEAEATRSKAEVAMECVKAYVAALGQAVDGEAEQAAVQDEVRSITERCQAALAET